jgi:hypothetical protein
MTLTAAGNLLVGRTSVIGSDNRLAVQLPGTSASGYSAPGNAAIAMDFGTSTNGVINLVGGGDLGIFRTNSSNPYDVGIGFGVNTDRHLTFVTANIERARITAAGDLLVGATSATAGSVTYKNLIASLSNSTTSATIGIQYPGVTTFGLSADSGSNFTIAQDGTLRLRIAAGGEVYIAGATDQGAYNLQCNGTGVWGAGAYVNGSDSRIKEDIAPISSSLDVVAKLNPVTYRYKESWSKDQSIQTGFIAQELLTALEDEVYVEGVVQQGGSEGYYSVAYQNIIPILTKAIQELHAEMESLKKRTH